MSVDRTDGRRGVGALLRDLAEGSATLVRDEVKLARLEVSSIVGGVGRGTAFVAIGGVLALLGTLCLLTGLVLLGGDQWLRDRYWLAALIVTAIALGIAVALIKRGMAQLSPANLAPDQTVASLKEDKKWLKRRLTSGATSN
jgi:Putative Actinobacterial Holin-X, holin superfamily III